MSNKKRTYGREFQLQGQAAVWQVASQLALRGHNVYFPGLDEGCDLLMDNGLRLQIKSATLQSPKGAPNYRNGAYCFALRRGAWLPDKKRYERTTLRSYSEVADVFVLWGIDENRFFIVPTSHKGQAIHFGKRGYQSLSNNRSKFDYVSAQRIADYEDRWDVLDVNSVSGIINGLNDFTLEGKESPILKFDFEQSTK